MNNVSALPTPAKLEWGGLDWKKHESADCHRATSGDFEWEVDLSFDEEGQYGARIYYRSLKFVSVQGKTRFAALSYAREALVKIETAVGNEAYERRSANRPHNNKGR